MGLGWGYGARGQGRSDARSGSEAVHEHLRAFDREAAGDLSERHRGAVHQFSHRVSDFQEDAAETTDRLLRATLVTVSRDAFNWRNDAVEVAHHLAHGERVNPCPETAREYAPPTET